MCFIGLHHYFAPNFNTVDINGIKGLILPKLRVLLQSFEGKNFNSDDKTLSVDIKAVDHMRSEGKQLASA